MTDQPERCPLCDGPLWDYTVTDGLTFCHNCGLTSTGWPRVRELVAIRDAVVRAYRVAENDPRLESDEWDSANNALWDLVDAELARQEAQGERPRTDSEANAD